MEGVVSLQAVNDRDVIGHVLRGEPLIELFRRIGKIHPDQSVVIQYAHSTHFWAVSIKFV